MPLPPGLLAGCPLCGGPLLRVSERVHRSLLGDSYVYLICAECGKIFRLVWRGGRR